MRKKFLHVVLIVASMAVICCVSAFAEMPYPEIYPELPNPLPASYCVLVERSGSVYLNCFHDEVGVFVSGDALYLKSNVSRYVYKLDGFYWTVDKSWSSSANQISLASVSGVLYCNFNIYDVEGNLIFNGGPPPPPPPDPYENFWSDLNEVGTGVLGWAGNVASTITQEPVLLFTVGIFILGAAIGIFRRLLVRG